MLSDHWAVGQTGHASEHNRIAERLNVAYYVTTMTGAEIQAALDAVAAAGRGVVMLLPGVYTVDATINMPWGVRLIGNGWHATTLKAQSGLDAVIKVTHENYIGHSLLRDFGIDGDNLAQSGIEWVHVGASEIDHVRVFDCADYGLYIHGGVWSCSVRFLSASGCFNGIYQEELNSNGQANYNTFEHCNLSSNRGAGMKLVGGTLTSVAFCDFEGNGTGGTEQAGILQSGNGQSLNVSHSYFEQNGTDDHPGSEIVIGDDLMGAFLAPAIVGNYFFGGKDLGDVGKCDHAITLQNTMSALVQSNRAWGYRSDVLHLAGELNVGDVAQANVFS